PGWRGVRDVWVVWDTRYLRRAAGFRASSVLRAAAWRGCALAAGPTGARLDRLGLVLVVGQFEELLRGRAHGQITRLDPSVQARRAIRVDLDEGRQLRLGPHDLLALAHDPAPNPDHALYLPTATLLTAARRLTWSHFRIHPGAGRTNRRLDVAAGDG